LQYYRESILELGLEDPTLIKYKRIANYLEQYLVSRGKGRLAPDQVDETLISDCLQYFRKSVPWSNGTYNKMLGFMSIMFNYLKKKRKVDKNPCDDIGNLRAVAYKHKYYDEKTLREMVTYLKDNDPYLYIAAQFVYYAGIRSSKELINLQVQDILLERDRIRFRGNATKGKRDDYILAGSET
jgi:site-specific recombinase XerD